MLYQLKPALVTCLISVAALALAVFYPYGTNLLPQMAFGLAICSMFFWLAAANICPTRLKGTGLIFFVSLTTVIPPLFVFTTRQVFDRVIPMKFEATVTSLYRSRNHQYAGLEFTTASGEVVRIEPIPDATWAALRVGDVVVKQPFRTYFTRGKDRLPVVAPSPFHSFRGTLP